MRLLGYFCLVLLFAGLFVTIGSISSYSNSRKQYLQKYQEHLQAMTTMVSSQVRMAFGQGVSIFQEAETIMNFKPEGIISEQQRSELWRVQELIRKAENSMTPLVVNEFIYYASDDSILESAGHYDKDFYFQDICMYQAYDRTFWDSTFSFSGRFVLPATMLTIRARKIPVIPVVTVTRTQGTFAVHVCNVSLAYLEQLLVSSEDGVGKFLIFDGNNTLIAQQVESPISESQARIIKDLADGGSNHIPRYYIASAYDDYTGWTVYGMLPQTYLVNTQRHLVLVTCIQLVVMILLGLLMVFFLSSSIYAPIKDVNSLLRGSRSDGQPQDGDDLQNIRRGVESLISNEDIHQQRELDYQLDGARHGLQLLINHIHIRNIEPMLATLRAQRGFIHEKYICAAILFEFMADEDMQGCTLMRQKLPIILRSILLPKMPCVVIPLEMDLFEVVFNVQSEDEIPNVMHDLENLRNVFAADSNNYSVSIGVGNIVNDITTIGKSHTQAIAALQAKDCETPFSLFSFAQLPPKKKITFSFYDQRGIINNIQTGNSESLQRYIEELIRRNEQCEVGPELMRELYRQILMVGRRVADDAQLSVEELPSYQEIYRILSVPMDEQQLQRCTPMFIRFFLEIQKLVSHTESSQNNMHVQRISSYLEQHYAEPITLTTVSEDLCLSAKYISRLYKSETNENITEALAKIRVEKAKQLLADPRYKVGQIAAMVGIDSRATFLRVFMKLEGISPTEYRKIIGMKQTIEKEGN